MTTVSDELLANWLKLSSGSGSLVVSNANLRAIITELQQRRADAAVRVREGWQDIATAPKDGTRIDGWLKVPGGPGHRITDMKWDEEVGEWRTGTANFSWPIEAPVHVETGEPVVKLTHWQPLPASPQPTAKEPEHG